MTLRRIGWMIVAAICASSATVPAQGLASTNQGAPPLPETAPPGTSPIDIFRRMLALSAAGREQFYTNKPPQQQDYLRRKIAEYLSLSPEDREARLQALELRWHLLPLMQLPPGQRASRLRAVPERLRPLVQERLLRWDILPPPLQKDVLDNQAAIRMFTQLRAAGGSRDELYLGLSTAQRERMERDYERWQQLPPERRQQMCDNFERFVGLDPRDQQKALTSLAAAERLQMQKTLAIFSSLPVEQRERVIDGFIKFKGLPPAERQNFLRGARQWQALSEKERQLWRRMVAGMHGAKAIQPPLPAPILMPPPLATNARE